MKLSIILPIYNREKEITRCLESVINQDIKEDIEIICINDGSTDNSKQIIEKYQKRYPGKIIYYEKSNSGIADTRNYGIQVSNGEYILFVDSDDYLTYNFLDKIEKLLDSNNEIIKFKLQREDEKGNILEKVDGPIFENVNGQVAFNMLAFTDVLLDSPCIYIIKKDLFIRNNFKFKVGTEHEDFGLIPLVLIKAKQVTSIPEYTYHYVQSSNSITRNEDYIKTKKKMTDVLGHYDNMIGFLEKEKEELEKITIKNLKTYYTNAIILKLKNLKYKDQKIMIKEMKKRKMIENIQVNNIKQWFKKVILKIDIRLYLKLK